jgi:hypothetical protein
MTTSASWTPNLESRRPLWRHGLLAAGLAAFASVVIYLLARMIGIPLELSLQPGAPSALLPIEMVVLMSVAGALGGIGLYALLRRVSGGVRIFQMVALAILLLSFAAPLTVTGADAGTRMTLMLMHVATGVSIIGVLSRASSN